MFGYFGTFRAYDFELGPEDFCAYFYGVAGDIWDVFGSAEDVDYVDLARDFFERWVASEAEYFVDAWVDRDYVVAVVPVGHNTSVVGPIRLPFGPCLTDVRRSADFWGMPLSLDHVGVVMCQKLGPSPGRTGPQSDREASGTISLSGGTVAGGASCTVDVDVTSSTIGAHVNTTAV